MAALAFGCAEGTDETDAGPGEDAGGGGMVDAGPPQCAVGEHVCGGGCVDDLPNEPENGCRLGCGDACEVPMGGVAACDDDGNCTLGCEPPFALVDGECVCEPRSCEDLGFMCGAPDDGCGTALDCGSCEGDAVCNMGMCGCALDDLEPNDRRIEVMTAVASVPNEDWTMVFDQWNLHASDDEDWIRLSVADSGVFDSNPSIRVTLDQIPMGSNYDLGIYYVCDENMDQSSCTSGRPDNSIGNGCVADASGTAPDTAAMDADCTGADTDDSGTLWIHVSAPTYGGMCSAYSLNVEIEN